MSASQKLIDFIKAQEAFCYKAYTPINGDKLTIGYGFTVMPNGKPVTAKDTITEQVADLYLETLLEQIDVRLYSVTPRPQNEMDAVISLCYNIGTNAFKASLSGQLFAQGKDISSRFILWNQFQGKPNKGLTARRLKEKRIYLTGDYAINLTATEKEIMRQKGFKV